MQGSPFPWSVDGLRRGSSGTANSGSSLSWCLVSSPGRAPANDRGLSASSAPLSCGLINTRPSDQRAFDSQEPAAHRDLRPVFSVLLVYCYCCCLLRAPHLRLTHPAPKHPPAHTQTPASTPKPEDPAAPENILLFALLPPCSHVPVSPGTACRMASYNEYHDYYDSRSRQRSRSRPPPLQPQYEQYEHYDAVPRTRVREDAYLSPTTVPYAVPMLCQIEA